MNLSNNIPQPEKIERDPQPDRPVRDKEPRVKIGTLEAGQHFCIPGDEDEEIEDRTGVVLEQFPNLTRVKFDPKPKEYTYPENIATATEVVLLGGVS